MAKRCFELMYAPEVKYHLREIERRHHSLIRKTIVKQLQFEPDTETRNRKPLQRPVAFEATWEIGFRPHNRFRVFYEVDQKRREVHVLAIGVKCGNRLFIGGKEIEL